MGARMSPSLTLKSFELIRLKSKKSSLILFFLVQPNQEVFFQNPKHLQTSPLFNMSIIFSGINFFYSGLFLEVFFSFVSLLPSPLHPPILKHNYNCPVAVHHKYNKIIILSNCLKDHSWCDHCLHSYYFSSPPLFIQYYCSLPFKDTQAFFFIKPVASEWNGVFHKIFKR